MISFFTNIHFV